MNFGICTGIENAAVAKQAGFDHIEVNAQTTFKGTLSDDEFDVSSIAGSALPVVAANVLVPAARKITGPGVDLEALVTYMTRVCARAASVGCRRLVFGSGGARNIPEGFDHGLATGQVVAFLKRVGPIAHDRGVTIVIEPLNRKESNLINTVAEGEALARQVAHPGVKLLMDTYHLWMESEPLTNVRRAGSMLKHIHVADLRGRMAPGLSGLSDYRAAFRILKEINYEGVVSVECSSFDLATVGPGVLDFLRKQWNAA
jgi:sugar phosphate isomerase/epimerase